MSTGAKEEKWLQGNGNSLQVFAGAPSGNSFSYSTLEGQGVGCWLTEKIGRIDKKILSRSPAVKEKMIFENDPGFQIQMEDWRWKIADNFLRTQILKRSNFYAGGRIRVPTIP